MDAKTFVDTLHRLKTCGCSVSEMSITMGVPDITVRSWYNGKRKPGVRKSNMDDLSKRIVPLIEKYGIGV